MSRPHEVSPIERTLRQHVLASLRRSFISPPKSIMIGFSGGNDSLALALLLRGLGPLNPAPVTLIHVDHRMQPGSDEFAHQAVRLASDLELPIEVTSAERRPGDTFPGVGPEEAARRVRYESFVANTDSGDTIALAHHAGDQSETVLLHLLRGSGPDGLAGMREIDHLNVPWWDTTSTSQTLTVWRPLLDIERADLEKVVAYHRLQAIEDPTNDDLAFRRNEIRHRLLPLMREIEPTIDERLGTLAKIMSDEVAWAEDAVARLLEQSGAELGLSKSIVRACPAALQRRLIRAWCHAEHGHDLSFDRVEAIRALIDNPNAIAQIELGNHFVAWGDRTHIHVKREVPAE